MAAYEYQAIDARGKQCKGVIEADTPRHARNLLREKKMMPLVIEQAAQQEKSSNKGSLFSDFFQTKVSAKDLSLITRQLSTLVGGGLPLEESLKAVAEQNEKPKQKSMLMAVRSRVVEGYGLAESMADFPGVFDDLYVAMVASGEKSGNLDRVLERLADYTEGRDELNSTITQAMVYPIVLIIVASLVVVFLLVAVVPDMMSQFAHMGQELPGPTQFLIATSDFLQAYWMMIASIIMAISLACKQALKKPNIKLAWHSVILRLPLIGKVARSLNTARFARTLSTLSSSGVPLLEAMKIAAEVMPNVKIRAAVSEATVKVREGSSLRASLQQTGLFPPMMLHMIASGEKSGELDNMLVRSADTQDREFASMVSVSLSVMQPVIVLIMAGAVLFIVMSILLPIMQMNDLVGI